MSVDLCRAGPRGKKKPSVEWITVSIRVFHLIYVLGLMLTPNNNRLDQITYVHALGVRTAYLRNKMIFRSFLLFNVVLSTTS